MIVYFINIEYDHIILSSLERGSDAYSLHKKEEVHE